MTTMAVALHPRARNGLASGLRRLSRVRQRQPAVPLSQIRPITSSSHSPPKVVVNSRVLACSPAFAYAVASDFQRYPEFVRWCTDCRVLRQVSATEYTITTTVGLPLFSETYTTHARFNPPHGFETSLGTSSLFKKLESSIAFEECSTHDNQSGALMTYRVEFEFKGFLQRKLGELFIDMVPSMMIDSIESRCMQLKAQQRQSDSTAATAAFVPASPLAGESLNSKLLRELEAVSHFNASEILHLHTRLQSVLAIDEPCVCSNNNALGSNQNTSGAMLCWNHCHSVLVDMFGQGFQEERLGGVIKRLFMRGCRTAIDHGSNELEPEPQLTEREMVIGVSILSKGTIAERSRLWFRSYAGGDGLMTLTHLTQMIEDALCVRFALNSKPAMSVRHDEHARRLLQVCIHQLGLDEETAEAKISLKQFETLDGVKQVLFDGQNDADLGRRVADR